MRRYIKRSIIVLGAIACWLGVQAQTETLPDSTDQRFVDMAVSSNRFEVAAGSQALERSDDAAVKQFGQMLVTDHTKVLDELEKAAVAKKLVIPDAMNESHAAILKSMGELSGNDFNKAFKEVMIKSHEDAIALFEQAARGSNDPELRSWAGGKIPSLKNHLEQAKALPVSGGTADRPTTSPRVDSVKTLK